MAPPRLFVCLLRLVAVVDVLAFARDLFHCARVSCARVFALWYA